ncbi:hypothetical protein F511_04986 [Dorcoceras hygrometricum]|uniref:Uncharacterized protein n=1 Tax=Dorcoceras hygrometricum TaxID=472368 RepID=A0A2Z7DBE2_9LAMI|nr:hypothetical protein F511_04986 [Dorcoceras hygrometricum]
MTRYNICISGLSNAYSAPPADASLGPTDLPEKPAVVKHKTKAAPKENKRVHEGYNESSEIQGTTTQLAIKNISCHNACESIFEKKNSDRSTQIPLGQLIFRRSTQISSVNSDPVRSTEILLGQLRSCSVNPDPAQSTQICIVNSQLSSGLVNAALNWSTQLWTGQLSFD